MTGDIAKEIEKLADDFGIDKKRSIGEVAQELGVEPHVIRFWEENFEQIKPEIGKGGRRYYYNKQLKILRRIKKFLHEEGYTIAGLQKLLKKRKADSYKEEDLEIIGATSNEIEAAESELPSANFVANVAQVTNINKLPETFISKEQRDEISSLLRNVVKNLGDLKMLLRS